ncbi:MAG: Aryl-alcohol dehydrogenase [Marmoricola sp.]|nr:Aryl-alcohol dehydrogenase [Marmoricola sp.]
MEITAAVVHELGADFQLETVTLGEPVAGEVLVAIAAVGLCHTDLAAQHGHLPFPLPGVFGHEGSGTVVSVGDGVTKVSAGDKVALTFNSCGDCTSCRADHPSYCLEFMPSNFGGARPDGTSALTIDEKAIGSNFFGQSSFATHAIAHERNVVKVDPAADLAMVSPLGCGVQTGAGAVMNSLDCQAGGSLLVMGGGSVGLSAVLAAVVRELSTIIVVEPVAKRRELALSLGATHAFDPADGPVSEQLRALLPEGVNYIIDTTANLAVIEQAFASLAHRGKLGLLGVPADPAAAFPLSLMGVQILGASVIGIVEGDSDPDVFIPELIALQQAGRFPVEKLVTIMPFSQINEAIAVQAQGDAVKVVLVHG